MGIHYIINVCITRFLLHNKLIDYEKIFTFYRYCSVLYG